MSILSFLLSLLKRIVDFVRREKASVVVPEPPLSPYEKLRRLYAENGFPWEPVNIFGIENASNPLADDFNDIIGIAYDGKIELWPATTSPGVASTKGGTKRLYGHPGAAHLCFGLHQRAYSIGKHRGYEALVQTGKVKIWRDANENFIDDDDLNLEGWFGINIHHAYNAKKIGHHSYGCQVLPSVEDHQRLMEICKAHAGEQKQFSYWLARYEHAPKFLKDVSS